MTVTYLPCICRSNALGASSNAKTESRIGWMDSVCAMSTGLEDGVWKTEIGYDAMI